MAQACSGFVESAGSVAVLLAHSLMLLPMCECAFDVILCTKQLQEAAHREGVAVPCTSWRQTDSRKSKNRPSGLLASCSGGYSMASGIILFGLMPR